jgi:D-3-phosphoglycerate dehydrogenase / 2-oxoglutarate reductase
VEKPIKTMEKQKILITDDVHPSLLEGFKTAGFDCTYIPKTTDEEVRRIIGDYRGLIVNSKINVDHAMFAAAPKLRFVGRLGSGMEIVDLKAARAFGVAVLSSPEGNRNAVAEHALGMLLSLSNNLIISDKEVKNFVWQREKNRGFELRGRTIGIIGFGHTGSSFAAKLLGLGMRILVYDKYLPTGFLDKFPFPKVSKLAYPRFDREGVESRESKTLGQDFDGLNYEFSTIEAVDLFTIQQEADIISFHLPLTPETKHYANEQFFNAYAKPIIILNTSRGNVVKTKDLVEALNNKKVIGAAIDVFENEKIISTISKSDIENPKYTEGVSDFGFEISDFGGVPKSKIPNPTSKRGGHFDIISDYKQLFAFSNVIVSPHIAGWTHGSKQRMAEVLLHKIFKVLRD